MSRLPWLYAGSQPIGRLGPHSSTALAEGEAAFDIAELNVTAGDRVAFATTLLRCGSTEELAEDNTPRLTIGLRKVEGTWKIAHEHHSFSAEVNGGRPMIK